MKKTVYILALLLLGAVSILAQDGISVFHQEVTWSPDGKRLSFTTYRKPDANSSQVKAEVYVMKTDGTGVKKIADDARWSSWSAGGKRILFSRASPDNKTFDLFTINTDGAGLVQLTRDARRNSTPVFSPDGKKIAFISTRDADKYQIYVMNADGSNVKRLTTDPSVAYYNPQWSPDGKRLVFYAEKGDRKDQVWVMNAGDGSGQTLLTGGIGHNTSPAWSADGKRIIFTSNRDGEDKAIYTMKSDGSDIKRLVNVKSFCARYSPDGKKLAFISGSFPSTEIFIADADGSSVEKISPK